MTARIKLTFLGTSGAIPSIKRNHTSILLSYKKENILIDCGEGTQRQFKKARLSPGRITRLLITHWHGDHVLGIPGLLQTLSFNNYKKTLFIYGPKGLKRNIRNVLKAFPSIMVSDTRKGVKIKVEEVNGKFLETEEFYLKAAKMTHGPPSNAYTFVKKGERRINKKRLKKSKLPAGSLLQKLKKGRNINYKGKRYLAKDLTFKENDKKISFVLDTTKNERIIPFVKNSDMLIMESSYSHELKHLAKKHRHMTAKQAAEISKRAKVGGLFLTHLSERYEKDPGKILDEAKGIFRNSFLAEDLGVVEI